MKRTVSLHAIAYDLAGLRPGETQQRFFGDREGQCADDTALSEHDLVEFLTAQAEPRAVLLAALSLPRDTDLSRKVTQPFLDSRVSRPGDIDLLLCPVSSPHCSVAIEFKRVRVREGSKEGQRVNRLGNLRGATAQTNGLHGLGFSQTYLGVIAVVHDLSDRSLNFVSRGLKEDAFSRLVHLVESLEIDPQIGILYVEIAQPQPEPITRTGVVAAGILRPPTVREQSADLTAVVERFFGGPR